MERHQMNPNLLEMSRAHAELRQREMSENIGAERALRPDDRESPGWLARTVAQGMVGLGGLMVNLGERLTDQAQPMQVSHEDGGC